jgi:penicillin-binding protein 2
MAIDLEETISQSGTAGRDLFGKQLLSRKIKTTPLYIIMFFCIVFFILCGIKLISLVTDSRDIYEKILYRNRLTGVIVSAPRGGIVDRYGNPLAQSVKDPETGIYNRDVVDIPGVGNLVGFIRYPQKDSSGYYWRFATEGVSGLEKVYDSVLRETPGYRYTSSTKSKKTSRISEEKILYPKEGRELITTLDSELTKELGIKLSEYIEQYSFDGGAALISNVHTGEVLSHISLPDIDPDSLSRGEKGVAAGYLEDPRHPLLNRALFGGFSPGSTVKPYMTLAFLVNDIIDAETKIYSNGKIVVDSPYDKNVHYTFRDWKPEGHGWTNAVHALSESVNTFYYTFGGGHGDSKGLGILKMKTFMDSFGLGQPVSMIFSGKQPGQVPDPVWKKKTFSEAWRLGDTYNSAIGQYGFIVTPLQQLRAVAAIANKGVLIDPFFIKGDSTEKKIIQGVSEEDWATVYEGMRAVVTRGTARSLDRKNVLIAAKSGTAQIKGKTRINSWVIGFWPYEKPRYAFVVLAENGPKDGVPNVSVVLPTVFDWMEKMNRYQE